MEPGAPSKRTIVLIVVMLVILIMLRVRCMALWSLGGSSTKGGKRGAAANNTRLIMCALGRDLGWVVSAAELLWCGTGESRSFLHTLPSRLDVI
jgi:hypothetical protein